MALDIHWALQENADYLDDEYSLIVLMIRALILMRIFILEIYTDQDLPDNAGYDPNFNVVYFGDGYVKYRPIATGCSCP